MADLRRRKPDGDNNLENAANASGESGDDKPQQSTLHQKLANELTTADSSDHVILFILFIFFVACCFH